MAVEAKRGCGYRKIGGIYLETDAGESFECGRMPIPLLACQLCDQRPKFTRGLQSLRPKNILHAASSCPREGSRFCVMCPFNVVAQAELVGLMWVGGKFYSPLSFVAEAHDLGISKRISQIPKWFKVGVHWVFLAHEQTISEICKSCGGKGIVDARVPIGVISISIDGNQSLFDRCTDCEGEGTHVTPGVFYAFRPQRIVKVVSDQTKLETIAALQEQGFTVMVVPHNDPDHQPSKKGGEDE